MNNFKKNKITALIGVAALATSLAATALDRVPVKFIVAASSNSGTEAHASTSELDPGIDQLNLYYNELGLEFYRDDIEYITNSDVDDIEEDWDKDNEEDVAPWFEYGSMNIIVTAQMDGVAGHAYWHYEQRDVIEIEAERLGTSTIAHEVGHNFSLKHTYQSSDDYTIAEAEGATGYKFGDSVQDTPIDPGERDYYENCVWIDGSAEDTDGQEYNPDGFNIMGKGEYECRDNFTSDQKKRMDRVIQTYKFHLFDKYGSGQNPSCANSTKVTGYPSKEQFNQEETVSSTPWVQDVFNDDFNWRIDPKTSDSDTGAPSAYEGQTFAHIDADGEFVSDGSKAAMLSPCYDITNKAEAEVRFRYFMYGADIAELTLEVTDDNGSSWDEVWSETGEQHNESSGWSTAIISLDQYVGSNIQLRFTGEVGDGDKGDISIDDIQFDASNTGSGGDSKTTHTQTFEIQHYKDDAEEDLDSGEVDRSSSDLELTEDGSDQQLVGIRFREISLPQGAKIESAKIQFTAKKDDSGSVGLMFHGHDEGDSDRFSSSDDDDISERDTTSKSVLWTPKDWDEGDAGSAQLTPELKKIVQQLVNRSDWNEYSAVTFIITNDSGSGERVAYSYDEEDSGDLAPKLIITWSE